MEVVVFIVLFFVVGFVILFVRYPRKRRKHDTEALVSPDEPTNATPDSEPEEFSDHYEGSRITIDKVISDPSFYKDIDDHLNSVTILREEIRRLEYGVHLMKHELFRLRAKWAGLRSEFVETIAPEYIPLSGFRDPLNIDHARLRQQAEFLRADLYVQAAMLQRTTTQEAGAK